MRDVAVITKEIAPSSPSATYGRNITALFLDRHRYQKNDAFT